MGLKSETRTIGHLEVTVTQMSAMRGLALLPRLGKAAEPAIKQIDLKTLNLENADITAMLGALVSLIAGLTPGEMMSLIRDINAGTQVSVDGRVVSISDDAKIAVVFDGHMLLLLQVTIFALEVNFRDFFAGLVANAPSDPRPPAA